MAAVSILPVAMQPLNAVAERFRQPTSAEKSLSAAGRQDIEQHCPAKDQCSHQWLPFCKS